MEIRVHGPGQDPEPLVVTMRTPGNDFDLAVGFCITEGVIDANSGLLEYSDAQNHTYLRDASTETYYVWQDPATGRYEDCGVLGLAVEATH